MFPMITNLGRGEITRLQTHSPGVYSTGKSFGSVLVILPLLSNCANAIIMWEQSLVSM